MRSSSVSTNSTISLEQPRNRPPHTVRANREGESQMRKLFVAATLTVFLAASANAADVQQKERGRREKDNPIVRIFRIVLRTISPAPQGFPIIPTP